MSELKAWTRLVSVAFALVACGGTQFTTQAQGAGGAGGGAGQANGGEGGTVDSGTAAASGEGGMDAAGTGGKSGNCDCQAGSYCQDGTGNCRSCTDFSRLEFASPVKIATLSQSRVGDERFPRPGVTTNDLFYRSGKVGAAQLWYDAVPMSGIGKNISGTLSSSILPPATTALPVDSGPLLVPGVLPQNFFFDRVDPSTNSRQILAASWPINGGGGAVLAPPPLNEKGDNFSVAIAPEVQRVYWMSTRNGKGAQLVWASVADGATSSPAELDIQIQVGNGNTCAQQGDDATPWVNLAGTLLLFRSVSVDQNCAPNDAGAYDIYAAPLSKDSGLAAGKGISLTALNVTGGGSNETDPSLSADSCIIYFASDGGSGQFDIYRAARN